MASLSGFQLLETETDKNRTIPCFDDFLSFYIVNQYFKKEFKPAQSKNSLAGQNTVFQVYQTYLIRY
jgi:hypothetical protein